MATFIFGAYSPNFCCSCKVHWSPPPYLLTVLRIHSANVSCVHTRYQVLHPGGAARAASSSKARKRTKIAGGTALIVTPTLQNLPTPSPGLLTHAICVISSGVRDFLLGQPCRGLRITSTRGGYQPLT